MITPRDLAARAAGHRFGSEADINQWLAQQHITDPETRLSLKIELMAQGALATDQHHAPGTMATDLSRHTPEPPPLGREVARLFRQARLEPGRSYSQAEVEDLLTRCAMGPTERIAVKAELVERGWLRATGARPAISAGRDMTAAAERPQGKVLLDPVTRKPAVLRSQPV